MRHRLSSVAIPVCGAARWPRWLLAGACGAVAAGLVAALGVVGPPVTTASAAGRAGPAAMLVTAVRQGAVNSVPLVTGGRVTVTAAGGQRSFLLRGAVGTGAAVWYQNAAGDRFIVPAVAVPYVGRELGSSLFDVSALARDRITGRARIPVRLRFAAGAEVAAPPGVKLTWARGEAARGYVTASSGRLFAAALARQNAADTVRGHLRHARLLFGGLANMTLAAPGTPTPARPGYPLHILRLKVIDETGQPANNAVVVVVNTDNVHRMGTGVPVVNGMARVAVPAGDYSAVGLFLDRVSSRAVIRDDFRVPASPAATTVTLAERSATSAVSVSVPRPVRGGVFMQTVLYRTATAGGAGIPAALLNLSIGGPPGPVYVSPVPAPKVGRLRYLTVWTGSSASGGYQYDTAFAFHNIPADERFVVHRTQVATVHEHLFADPASHGPGGYCDNPDDPAQGSFGQHSPGVLVFTYCSSVAAPGNLTDYVGTATGDRWIQDDYTAAPGQVSLAADPRVFLPGRSYSVQWGHGPLAPTLGQHTGPWVCQACTAGSTLSLRFSALGDSEPDHFYLPGYSPFRHVRPRLRFTLYRDGTKLLSTRRTAGAVVRGIPARPSTYRAVLGVSLAGQKGVSQSTHTLTDLTVRYAPGRGTVLPRGDICTGQSAGSPCRVLPALTLGYQLATNEDNTSGAPVQVLHLRVGHLSYNGTGSHAPITSAAVWVSFDNGKSWQRATMTGSAGSYTATWPNPASAAGTSPEIKVTATDAVGGLITQTITSAYTIATSHGRSPR